jgi:hypothetical protein
MIKVEIMKKRRKIVILTVISDVVDCWKLNYARKIAMLLWLVEVWRKFPNRSKKGSLCLNMYPTLTDLFDRQHPNGSLRSTNNIFKTLNKLLLLN